MKRAALWGAALALVGCGRPTCPSVPVVLPVESAVLPWLGDGYAVVDAGVDGQSAPLVLDTGFDQTSFGAGISAGSTATVQIGAASAGPLAYGLVDAPGGVLGNDVLHQLPLVHDARARTSTVLSAFGAAAADAVALTFLPTRDCRDPSQHQLGPLGPYALVASVSVDGQALQMVLDTGAAATFLRSSVAQGLSTRPVLSGLLVGTTYAGVVPATATRARALSAGAATSAESPLLSAPAIDTQLDRVTQELAAACQELSCGTPPQIDGFLGWTFLREFQVSLAGAASARSGRTVELNRFSLQDHWTRDFVGIGTVTAPVDAGLEVLGLLSVSPAADAGVAIGDVITTVDGVPAQQAPTPFAPVGTAVTLAVQRGSTALQFSVPVADLLPNPP